MIKNILFDIGSVLVEDDREASIREFSLYSETLGPEEFAGEHVFLTPFQPLMERGEITPREYYEKFLIVSGCRISYRHFGIIWARHFSCIEPMIAMGRALARKLKVYFFSNTNPLHIPVLYDIHPRLLFFHGQALSYELGALKPESAFFERALAKFGLEADECLFIDDKAENVESAQDSGIRSIRHTHPGRTRERVCRESGVSGL